MFLHFHEAHQYLYIAQYAMHVHTDAQPLNSTEYFTFIINRDKGRD